MPTINPAIADQVKYCLDHRFPWSWASPRGLHTDGVVLWFYTLPIACVEKPFERVCVENPDIIGFSAKGYSATTTQVVNAVVRPIATLVIEDVDRFGDHLQEARKFYVAAYIPTPKLAMSLAKTLREWGQEVTR